MSDFNHTSKAWLVRISPKLKIGKRDYNTLQKQIEQNQCPIWDKDSRNRIQVGNYLGFIVGDKGSESVIIHKVIRDGPVEERHVTWKTNTPYNTGKQRVNHRETIYLSVNSIVFSWRWWKQTVKYSPNCPSWVPQGTTRCRKNPLKELRDSHNSPPPSVPKHTINYEFVNQSPPIPPPFVPKHTINYEFVNQS